MAATFPERPVRSLYMHIQYVSRRDGVSKGIRTGGISLNRTCEDDAHGVEKGKGKENLMHQEVGEREEENVNGAAMVEGEEEERKEGEEGDVIKVTKVTKAGGRTQIKSGTVGAKAGRRAGRKAGLRPMAKVAVRAAGGPTASLATLRAGASPRLRTRSRSRSLSFLTSASATTFGESREQWLKSVATATGDEVAGADDMNGCGAGADEGTRAGSLSVEMARTVWEQSFAVLADDLAGDRLTDAISSGIVDLETVSSPHSTCAPGVRSIPLRLILLVNGSSACRCIDVIALNPHLPPNCPIRWGWS